MKVIVKKKRVSPMNGELQIIPDDLNRFNDIFTSHLFQSHHSKMSDVRLANNIKQCQINILDNIIRYKIKTINYEKAKS